MNKRKGSNGAGTSRPLYAKRARGEGGSGSSSREIGRGGKLCSREDASSCADSQWNVAGDGINVEEGGLCLGGEKEEAARLNFIRRTNRAACKIAQGYCQAR